ncbi:hypothetical protein KI387_026639, partial [Taxus chinensis]
VVAHSEEKTHDKENPKDDTMQYDEEMHSVHGGGPEGDEEEEKGNDEEQNFIEGLEIVSGDGNNKKLDTGTRMPKGKCNGRRKKKEEIRQPTQMNYIDDHTKVLRERFQRK